MTDIGATRFYSGFRLHPGGAFPTSRTLDAQPRTAPGLQPAETSLNQAPAVQWGITVVGGLLPVLVQSPGPDSTAPTSNWVIEAYREIGDGIDLA